jgi:hypothetical protein
MFKRVAMMAEGDEAMQVSWDCTPRMADGRCIICNVQIVVLYFMFTNQGLISSTFHLAFWTKIASDVGEFRKYIR